MYQLSILICFASINRKEITFIIPCTQLNLNRCNCWNGSRGFIRIKRVNNSYSMKRMISFLPDQPATDIKKTTTFKSKFNTSFVAITVTKRCNNTGITNLKNYNPADGFVLSLFLKKTFWLIPLTFGIYC